MGAGEHMTFPWNRVDMDFDDEGDGYVLDVDGQEESVWLMETSKKTLEMGIDNILRVTTDKGSVTRHSQLFNKRSAAFVHEDFKCEVYISEIPRRGAKVRWALPHMMEKLFGDRYDQALFKNLKKSIRNGVSRLPGCNGEAMLVNNTLSVQRKALSANRPATMEELLDSDVEYATPTEGFGALETANHS
jgi:hypothetical protein